MSFSLSLIGIFILLIVSETESKNIIDIKESLEKEVDQEVKIKGKITTLTETPGLILLNLKDNTGEIKALLFKEEKINLQKSIQVEVTGIIKEYKNEKEIEISSIKRI